MDRVEQVKAVIALIDSGKSETASCLEVGINRATFRAAALRVLAGDSYARALESLAGAQVEKVERAIADMRKGKLDAAQARVEIDARKWFASKFFPKQYGDRLDLNHSGSLDAKAPREMTRAEIMAELALLPPESQSP